MLTARRILLVLIYLISIISCNTKLDNQKNKSDSVNKPNAHKSDEPQPKNDTLTNNQNSDWLLVPGKSAGKTQINQDAELVYKNLGKPDGGDAAMGKSVAIWYARHDSTSYSTSIYTTRDMGNNPIALVKQIRITSPSFKTNENIGVTSDLSEIRKIYTLKIAEKFMDSGQEYTVYDAKEGIAFEIGENGKCVAIILHEPGKTIPGTYLKFRTTNKFIGKK